MPCLYISHPRGTSADKISDHFNEFIHFHPTTLHQGSGDSSCRQQLCRLTGLALDHRGKGLFRAISAGPGSSGAAAGSRVQTAPVAASRASYTLLSRLTHSQKAWWAMLVLMIWMFSRVFSGWKILCWGNTRMSLLSQQKGRPHSHKVPGESSTLPKMLVGWRWNAPFRVFRYVRHRPIRNTANQVRVRLHQTGCYSRLEQSVRSKAPLQF